MRNPALALLMLLPAAVACNDTLTPPPTGAVEVVLVVTGLDGTSGPFTVAIDKRAPVDGMRSGAVIMGLESGKHTLVLTELGSTCGAAGTANATFVINPPDTTAVSVPVNCTAATGVIAVQATTTGGDPDQNGYLLSVDFKPVRSISPNGLVQFAGLSGGTHRLDVSGLARNCALTGPNPLEVSVSVGGAVRDTVSVPLTVACTDTTGTLRVTMTTTGSAFPQNFLAHAENTTPNDAPGYWAYIPPNGPASIAVLPGTYDVSLQYVPSNCAVTGEAIVPVTIEAGKVTDLAFTLTCAPWPTLDVTVVTTGANAPSTYIVGVDVDDYWGGYMYTAPAPSNGSASIPVLPGTHLVTLDQVPLNCTVTSPNNVSINVPLGPPTELAFAVTCQ